MKLKWQAPEVVFYNKETEKSTFYAKSDVWSYGEYFLLFTNTGEQWNDKNQVNLPKVT
jgi:hypothetical protein